MFEARKNWDKNYHALVMSSSESTSLIIYSSKLRPSRRGESVCIYAYVIRCRMNNFLGTFIHAK